MDDEDKKKEDGLQRQADECAEQAAASLDFLLVERQATIQKAHAGDRRAAKAILKEFSAIVSERSERTWNGPLPFEYAQYLAEAFRLITIGRLDADKALGLRPGEGGRPAIDSELKRLRYYRHCLRVLRLKASGSYETIEDAKRAAARKLKVSKSEIDLAWKSKQRLVAEIEFLRRRSKAENP